MIWGLMALTLLTSWWLPWWIYLIWAALFGWKATSPFKAFGLGFLGVSVTWILAAAYQDYQALGIISERLAGMFGLSQAFLIYFVIGGVSGVSAGLFSVCGYYLSELRPIKRLNIESE